MADLDAALKDLGQFGWFQVYYFILLLFPVVLSGFRGTEYVFTTMNIPHRCLVPECDAPSPQYSPSWVFHAVPPGQDPSIPQACLRFTPRHGGDGDPGHNGSCPAAMFTNVTEACHSWVFSEPVRTIAVDFDILCPADYWKLTFLSSISVFTGFLGEPLSGILSDKVGRKSVLVYGSIYISVAGLVRSFSPSYTMLAVIEGIDGLICGALFSPAFLLGLETLSPKKRLLGSMLINMYWPVGEMMIPFIMWIVQDWRYLLRVFYTPMLVISILLYWFLPESVRWLYTRGKQEQVKKVFLQIAKLNNTESLIPKVFENLHVTEPIEKSDVHEHEKGASQSLRLGAVFKSPIILWRVATCALLWITNIYTYYSINQSAAYFGDNQYVSFLLVCLVEFPAYLASLWVPDLPWLGRKGSMISTFVLAGVSSLAMLFVTTDQVVLSMLLYLVGKFCCTLGFTVICLYTAEIFPTELRHSLLAFCSMSGRVGAISSQQTPLLAPYVAPMLVISVACFAGALLSLSTPETLGTKLPDTIEEAETIGRGEPRTAGT